MKRDENAREREARESGDERERGDARERDAHPQVYTQPVTHKLKTRSHTQPHSHAPLRSPPLCTSFLHQRTRMFTVIMGETHEARREQHYECCVCVCVCVCVRACVWLCGGGRFVQLICLFYP
jgi:hypothetical protein